MRTSKRSPSSFSLSLLLCVCGVRLVKMEGGPIVTDANFLSSLQYQNRKAEYFKAIWDVINWKAAEKRFK